MGCSGSKAADGIQVKTPPCTATVVMNFGYTYNEGKKEEVNAILTKIIEYNREAKMFGPVLYSFSFKEHADGNGYDAQEVFVDAEAVEKYYRNFETCPFMEECMSLASMITSCKSEIIATAEEKTKAPTIS